MRDELYGMGFDVFAEIFLKKNRGKMTIPSETLARTIAREAILGTLGKSKKKAALGYYTLFETYGRDEAERYLRRHGAA